MYEVTAMAPEGPEEVYQAGRRGRCSESIRGTTERAEYCAWNVHGGRSVKRTSNHSEQRLFREEVLCFTRKFVPMAQNL